MKRLGFLLGLVAVAATIAAVRCSHLSPVRDRQVGRSAEVGPEVRSAAQHEWAQRLEEHGLPNLYRVTEDLYRGAQPTADGMRRLEEMAVKTVVNLRSLHSDEDELEGTGLDYEHIPVRAWSVKDEDVVRFLGIVTDADRTPVFVHCQHGADRTGLMCAVYRVAVCGWTKEEAIEEMVDGEFGFHSIHRGLIKYLREMDMKEMKQKAALPE